MPATKYNPELLKKFQTLVDKWEPFKHRGRGRDEKILDSFFDLGYQSSIAFHLSVSRKRIKDYRDKHPAFKEVYEEWLRKRDHYFMKLARIYHSRDKHTAQWIYISKNILGWSDNPTNTNDDNTLPELIKVIEDSARKISAQKKKKTRGSKKK